MEYQSSIFPPLRWAQFHTLLLEKYVPHTPNNNKKDEFWALDQVNIFIKAYNTKFNILSQYATQLLGIDNEMIWLFVKSLNTGMQNLSAHNSSIGKTINKATDYL